MANYLDWKSQNHRLSSCALSLVEANVTGVDTGTCSDSWLPGTLNALGQTTGEVLLRKRIACMMPLHFSLWQRRSDPDIA
jgi:hypothetical protein